MVVDVVRKLGGPRESWDNQFDKTVCIYQKGISKKELNHRNIFQQIRNQSQGVGWVIENIIFCYIIIVNFVVFHLFQFSSYLLFNKSSVQKKTAERIKIFDFSTFKLKSGHVQFQIAIFHFSLDFRNYKKIFKKYRKFHQ